MLRKALRVIILSITAVKVTSCGFNSRHPDIISSTSLGDIEVVAMEATHRAIIASRTKKGEILRYCAEPPPDATASLASSISTALDLNSGEDKSGSLDIISAIAKSAGNLYTRSHAVQLFRDASFSLCQAHLSGIARLNSSGFEKDFKSLYDRAREFEDQERALNIEKSRLNSILFSGPKYIPEYSDPFYFYNPRPVERVGSKDPSVDEKTIEPVAPARNVPSRADFMAMRFQENPELAAQIERNDQALDALRKEQEYFEAKVLVLTSEGLGTDRFMEIFEELVETTAGLLRAEIAASVLKSRNLGEGEEGAGEDDLRELMEALILLQRNADVDIHE